MLRGLSVSVEMNGDLILDTGDMLTWSLVVSGVHCTVTSTSVFTVSGSVTVQVRVCEVLHTVDHWEHSEPQLGWALCGHTYTHIILCTYTTYSTHKNVV